MIGIFDSGIWGLNVFKTMKQSLGQYDMIYFGDTAQMPYGNKSPEFVLKYSIQALDFLVSQGAKLIIIACNTASSVAGEEIKLRFNIPVLETITPALELAVDKSRKGRIGVIGTKTSAETFIYKKKLQTISPAAKIWHVACPFLGHIVEEGWIKKPETKMIIKKYLRPLKDQQIDTLISGSTQYFALNNLIQLKIGKRVCVIDSGKALTDHVSTWLKAHPETQALISKNNKSRFFVSDITPQIQKTAKNIIKSPISLELAAR